MAESITYLLILKNRVGFGSDVKEMLRVFTPDKKEPATKTFGNLFNNGLANQLSIPAKRKHILLYDEKYITDSRESTEEKNKRYGKCRTQLCQILPCNNIRIFYHKGGEFSTIKEITDDFASKFWPDANVMPYSVNIGLSWKKAIDNACNKFVSGKFNEAFIKLDVAWNIAFSYYNVSHPVRVILDALFPLYVDLSNCQFDPLEEEDYKAAVIAAKNNLKGGVAKLGLEVTTLEKILKAASDNLPNSESGKLLAKTSIDLLKMFKGLILDNANGFQYRFNILSEGYTRYLELLDVSGKGKTGFG